MSTQNQRTPRPRRTSLAVPGSSVKMLDKSQELDSDQLFLDLEDSVAANAKDAARRNVIEALHRNRWGERIIAVRVNDWTTQWTVRDVVNVIDEAGARIDCIMLPKVQDAAQVVALDLLVTQLEQSNRLPVGRIGFELQIEDAKGLSNVDEIAAASPRNETLIFGPGDFMASMNMKALAVGGQPDGYAADAFHYVLMRILVAARANGLQAIDGPYGLIKDVEGFRAAAASVAALGFDGKWVLHPSQVAPGNEVFSPGQEEYDRAEEIVEAYDWYTSDSGGSRGAVMLGDDFIDEASRKMALVVVAKGRAAGMARTRSWSSPESS